jgi:hypothetical protein
MSSDRGRRTEDGGRSDDRLGAAIDRAVRGMLDVEPPAGLRGRVLHRIAGTNEPAGSPFWRNFAWLAVPVTAAAILVLAVLVPWRQAAGPASTAVPTAGTTAPGSTVHIPELPRPARALRSASSPARHTVPSRRPPVNRRIEDRLIVDTAAAADDASAIDPLSPIAPITVGAVRPPDIAPKQIAISPLAPITELQVAPLFPPDRRN